MTFFTTTRDRFATLLCATIAGLAVCAVLTTALGAQEPSDLLSSDDGIAQRPTGSGTKPDGLADESIEGLFNETDTEDFIDDSSATEVTPPLIDAGEVGPDPVTSAENLEPASDDGDFETIERATNPEHEDG